MPYCRGSVNKTFLGGKGRIAYSELNMPGWCGSIGRDVHAEGLKAFVLHSVETQF